MDGKSEKERKKEERSRFGKKTVFVNLFQTPPFGKRTNHHP
jgi:hypothetical protein